jgi:hypothetical protein
VAAVVAIAVVGMTALVLVAPPASADTAAFCTAVNKFTAKINSGPDSSDTAGLKSTATIIKKAAKVAPKSIQPSMNTMASFYSDLAGASKTEAAVKIATGSGSYAKAVSKFTLFYVKNCSDEPTTTTNK